MSQESTVEATIQGVEFENGWYRVNTDQGEFSTKWQDRGIEAQQFQGQRVLIAFTQGDPRQGRNGQWYTSRYLNRITAPGYVPPQLPGTQPGGFAQAPSPQMPGPPQQPPTLPPRQMGEDENTRNTRIMRQTAGKLAVWTLPLVPSEQRTFQNQIAIAEAWMRYFIGGAQGTGVNPANGMEPQQADQFVGQVTEGMGAPSDGIPF